MKLFAILPLVLLTAALAAEESEPQSESSAASETAAAEETAVTEAEEGATDDGVDAAQAERAAELLAAMAAEDDPEAADQEATALRYARDDLRAALFALRTAQAELERGLHSEAGESFLTAHLLVKQIDDALKPQLRRELAALDHRFVAIARGMLESQYLDTEEVDADEQPAEALTSEDAAGDAQPDPMAEAPDDQEAEAEVADAEVDASTPDDASQE